MSQGPSQTIRTQCPIATSTNDGLMSEEQAAKLDGLTPLPDQTGHAGEFLRTDGTDPLWAPVPGGAGGTLATTYANGSMPSDSIMSLDSTRGPVLIRDNATPLTGSLFAVQSSDGSFSFIDVNPTVNAVQFGWDGTNYGVSLAGGGGDAIFNTNIAMHSDAAFNIGSVGSRVGSVFATSLNSGASTLDLIGNGTQINLSSTGLDPNVDAGPTLGTISHRWLSFASKTGTIFFNGMGTSTTFGRGLLFRGTALGPTTPGIGVAEYSPLCEFQQAYGQTNDPESGDAQSRWAFQGRMDPDPGSTTIHDRLAVLSDNATGVYAEVFAFAQFGVPKWSNAANAQTTVGAPGAASAVPVSPTKYLKVQDSAGNVLVVPAFASV